MLTRLLVRNVVLINTLDLDFTKGLTVLTGETGAGNPFCIARAGAGQPGQFLADRDSRRPCRGHRVL